MRYKLLMKGSYEQALEAVQKKVPSAKVVDRDNMDGKTTILVVSAPKACVEEIRNWFFETDEPPAGGFPLGTLLSWEEAGRRAKETR